MNNLAAHLLRRSLGPALGPTLGPAITRVRRWPVESQLTARRNAMVAATALAQRRAERDEVEAYLTARQAPVPAAPGRAAHG